ncbi:ornithine cyclodeaminase family protein [Pollutimonas harenae]|uniref:Ornithine cyclodeaminase family protein n=1 Tax=Pollutimonas harenae TaxID=657015 RepID=A0A853GQK4_9BURK|nr:ornithine cyclodeaminase family protein [Pollutimonas harenae]NYT84421.1 ornithine cyclodeaminase family protein [Pollutimonas harenae]TEA73178.1 ornithine cyclodeaminase family protein [Pollutimonas harenae]
MKIFNQEKTRAALSFERLVPALKDAFIESCQVPLRHVHRVEGSASSMTTLIMPAWVEGGFMGIKTVNIAPGNSALGKPGLHSTYLLFDATTGEPLALMDGDEITSRRTAAASALAASFLAREDAARILIVGTGRVASLLADAYAVVRPGCQVQVWNRQESSAVRLVQDLQNRGFDALLARDLSEAVASADIVTCATLASAPIVHGEWLQPGSHLDLIGSFTPAMREADDHAFKDARIYVDTQEALIKSGELLEPMSRKVFTSGDVVATLEDLCRDGSKGRQSQQERTVFKSVGTALEDLTAATLVYGHEQP